MNPEVKGSGRHPVYGPTVRLHDGTVVTVDGLMAEARRLQAREMRRLIVAAVRWIGQTARAVTSLVPASVVRRKIPRAGALLDLKAATADTAAFQTDAALGHVACAPAEINATANGPSKGVEQPLAA